MNLLAALAETMTETQKQLVGFVIVAGLILLTAWRMWRNGNKVTVALAAGALVVFLARGIGQGTP